MRAGGSGPRDALEDKCLLYPRATPVGHCRGMLIPQPLANTDDLHLRPCPPGGRMCVCVCVSAHDAGVSGCRWLTDEATGGPATRVCACVCGMGVGEMISFCV